MRENPIDPPTPPGPETDPGYYERPFLPELPLWVWLVWGLIVGASLAVLIYLGVETARAQEAPARPMKSWQLGWLPGIDNADTENMDRRFRVDVYDTEGVCLYVVSGYQRTEPIRLDVPIALGMTSAIAAVPKTQLPKGAGCQ
jgi:hypothetical protein